MSENMRMDAYYYGFSSTGVEVIDRILSAVACAGKAYHHTEGWAEETEPYQDCFKGACPIDWIQNAANEAAAVFSGKSVESANPTNANIDKPGTS